MAFSTDMPQRSVFSPELEEELLRIQAQELPQAPRSPFAGEQAPAQAPEAREEPNALAQFGRAVAADLAGRIFGPATRQAISPPRPAAPETQVVGAGSTLATVDPNTGRVVETFTAPQQPSKSFLTGKRVVDQALPEDDPRRFIDVTTPEIATAVEGLLNRAVRMEPGRFQVQEIPLEPQSARKPGDLFVFRRGEEGPVVAQVFGDDPKLETLLEDPSLQAERIGGGASPIGALEINLEKSTKAKEEQKVIGQVESLARLDRIEQAFDPEFFQTLPQAQNAFAAITERLGFEPSREDRRRLDRFATLAQDINENLALFIKDITGAQMSEAEAQRLSAIQINKGDSPTQAFAKLQNKIGTARLAIVRSNILLNQGIENDFWQVMTLSGTKSLVSRLADESMEAFREQGLDEEQAFEAARRELQSKIGVDPQLIVTIPDGTL